MLFEAEEQKKEIPVNVDRFRRGEGTYLIVRFRNKADLDKFADLIDEPRLKAAKKNSLEKIQWHADKNRRDAMSQFFEDEE